MTTSEALMILFESLSQSEKTRSDFFRNKMVESNCRPKNFLFSLQDAYRVIHDYVNGYEYDHWWFDEQGNKCFDKQAINLFHWTNGKMVGIIQCDDLSAFQKALDDFGDIVYYEDQTWESNIKNVEKLKKICGGQNNTKSNTILTLPDYMDFGDESERIEAADFLKDNFSKCKGKSIAYMIFALEKRHHIRQHGKRPLIRAIQSYFDNNSYSESSVTKYLPPQFIIDMKDKDFQEVHRVISSSVVFGMSSK